MNELEELRLKIAKKKGWKWYTGAYRVIAPNEYIACGWFPEELTDKHIDYLPDWPNDIAAAWELVEEIAKAGYWVEVVSDSPAEYPKWSCEIFWKSSGSVFIVSRTAPEAICRAWLAWQESRA